jgi:SAM-dependent methyltransferase
VLEFRSVVGRSKLVMQLKEIVPWGRTLAEYQLMFDLSDLDLNKQILGCGDGPASFNAEMTELGYSVVSIDPVYQFSNQQIEQRVRETYETIIFQVRQNSSRYLWNYFDNPDELGRARLAAMEKFLGDYEIGKIAGRYLDRSLPNLDMPGTKFDLCVCSHLLFLYSEQLSLDFHIASIHELLKISTEVRIFPLLTLDCQTSSYLEPVMLELSSHGFHVQIQQVNYEFQKGGDRMLKIVNSRGN